MRNQMQKSHKKNHQSNYSYRHRKDKEKEKKSCDDREICERLEKAIDFFIQKKIEKI